MERAGAGRDEIKELMCTTTDLYIAGHAHVMEDNGQLEDCSVTQIVSGGGGASVRAFAKDDLQQFAHPGYGFFLQ
jgi:hypothetical protein